LADEVPERLAPYIRFALAGFGVLALLAAAPVGFYSLIVAGALVGGWHGVTPRAIDWAAGLSLFAFPLLLLALAGFSLVCTNRRRLIVVASVAAAVLVDGGLALRFLNLGDHRDHGPSCCVTTYPDVESAEAARKGLPPPAAAKAAAVGGPETVSVACSPVTGRCVSGKTKAR
jgi:hypothetical protein